MAKRVDARDLKSRGKKFPCRFESCPEHSAKRLKTVAVALGKGDPRYDGRLDGVIPTAETQAESMWGVALDHVSALTDRVTYQLGVATTALTNAGQLTANEAASIRDFAVPDVASVPRPDRMVRAMPA